jgi:hypothetical protein
MASLHLAWVKLPQRTRPRIRDVRVEAWHVVSSLRLVASRRRSAGATRGQYRCDRWVRHVALPAIGRNAAAVIADVDADARLSADDPDRQTDAKVESRTRGVEISVSAMLASRVTFSRFERELVSVGSKSLPQYVGRSVSSAVARFARAALTRT